MRCSNLLKQHFVLTYETENNIIPGLSRNRPRLKRITDAFVFAREGRILEGVLPVSALERLHDLVTEVTGEVAYRLQGSLGARGESMLSLEVSGVLPLTCQRCLDSVLFTLEVDSLLELVPEGVDMSQDELEDDTRDFLPVASELDIAALVEDEILLALPVAPRHEKCSFPGAADAGERVNPFATLAGLKGKPN